MSKKINNKIKPKSLGWKLHKDDFISGSHTLAKQRQFVWISPCVTHLLDPSVQDPEFQFIAQLDKYQLFQEDTASVRHFFKEDRTVS
jgi:hypothetical protein